MSEHTPPIRGRKGLSKSERFNILRRDGHRCTYCGASSSLTGLHVDHVVPVCEGGTNDPSNLVTACQDCNLGKSGKVLVPLNVQHEAESVAVTWQCGLLENSEGDWWYQEYKQIHGPYDEGRYGRDPLPRYVLEERVPYLAQLIAQGLLPNELHRQVHVCQLAFTDHTERALWARFTAICDALQALRMSEEYQ